MGQLLTVNEYVEGIKSANISILSRAITLCESSLPAHNEIAQQIINQIHGLSGNSLRLGITGVPGVGKSSFIECFGKYIVSKGSRLAVLAIDPSSSISKGSILGDKTRMEELSKLSKVFIRPSPSSGHLGGIAKSTYQTMLLCEAAGFDYIIIETVGVGQSETMVRNLCDFFLLLMLAGAGDELQGIKRGIMEMADSILITKADGANIEKSKLAQLEFKNALHLMPATESGWIPQVLTCSSTENKGFIEVFDLIERYKNFSVTSGYFKHNRQKQKLALFKELLHHKILERFYKDNVTQISKTMKMLESNELDLIEALNTSLK